MPGLLTLATVNGGSTRDAFTQKSRALGMSHVFCTVWTRTSGWIGRIFLSTLDLDPVHDQVLTLDRPIPREKLTRTDTSD